jgi:hypothetical protein
VSEPTQVLACRAPLAAAFHPAGGAAASDAVAVMPAALVVRKARREIRLLMPARV